MNRLTSVCEFGEQVGLVNERQGIESDDKRTKIYQHKSMTRLLYLNGQEGTDSKANISSAVGDRFLGQEVRDSPVQRATYELRVKSI